MGEALFPNELHMAFLFQAPEVNHISEDTDSDSNYTSSDDDSTTATSDRYAMGFLCYDIDQNSPLLQ